MKFSQIVLLFQKKQYQKVINVIDNELDVINSELTEEQDIDATKIQYYKALCYANLHLYGKALEHFDFVLASDLSVSLVYQCRMIKGYLYTITNRMKLAETEFNELLQNGYESSRVYASAAHVAYRLNKSKVALQHLQRAILINPDNTTALNSYSYILADHNTKLSLALQYIEKALKQSPVNPSYLDTYGLVLIRLQRFAEAKRVLTFASSKSDDPLIQSHLAIVDERMG